MRKLSFRVVVFAVFCAGVQGSAMAQITWQKSVGSCEPTCFATGQNGLFFAGCNGEGVLTSSDQGTTWNNVNDPSVNVGLTGKGHTVTGLLCRPDGSIFASTEDGVFRSQDGKTWVQLSKAGMVDSTLNCIALDQDGNLLVGGYHSDGIYRSTDQGKTWIIAGLSGQYSVQDIVTGSGSVLFAGLQSGLFRSTDKGVTWNSANGNLAHPEIQSVVVTPSGTLIVATNGYGLFRSADNGVTWSEVNAGMSDKSSRRLLVTKSGSIWASYNSRGVLLSMDDGMTWNSMNANLGPNIALLSLGVDSAGHIYAGDNDIYRTEDVIESAVNMHTVQPFTLEQNQPNPASHQTTIRFNLPQASTVSLKIFDLLGHEIATLADGHFGAGPHEVEWNAGEEPPGVYFCRITTLDCVQTREVIIQR